MFGLGGPSKEMKAARTGAREKLAKAREAAARDLRGGVDIHTEHDKSQGNPRVGAAVVYCVCFVLAVVLAEGPIAHGGISLRTGNEGMDKLMFSGTPANFSGNSTVDYILTLMIRAFVFWILAGLLPFCSLAWQRALDKKSMSPYRIMWGMPAALIAIFFGVRDFLGPLLSTLLGTMR